MAKPMVPDESSGEPRQAPIREGEDPPGGPSVNRTLSRKSTTFALSMLERIFRAKIRVVGVENLNGEPTLFVINHFTRAETFIVPWVLYKQTGEYVHTLANPELFVGRFGEYLSQLGVIRTDEPDR